MILLALASKIIDLRACPGKQNQRSCQQNHKFGSLLMRAKSVIVLALASNTIDL
jgi:hypothetical protein